MATRRIAVIPARYGSTRFPGKPLALIRGKPMIQRTFEQVSKCTEINELHVATDDDRIFQVIKSAGGSAIMTSADCKTGTDRVFEAVRELSPGASDVVVNVQGDEPLIDPRNIDLLVRKLVVQDEKAVMGTIAVREARPPEQDPGKVKVVVDQASNALYFSRSEIPHGGQSILRHVGLYAFRFSFLEIYNSLPVGKLEKLESLEQLRVLEAGYDIKVYTVEGPVFPGVDTKQDLEMLEQEML